MHLWGRLGIVQVNLASALALHKRSFMLANIFAAAMSAQSVTQKGMVYKYNGKNPRTPLGGVYIKVSMADSGVISNDDGTFTLVLNNLKMGSRLGDVRVTEADMMIFNQHAVDEWTVRKEPLCLILCDADEFQKQKQKLIAIGESQIKKKYDSKLAELKKQDENKQLKIPWHSVPLNSSIAVRQRNRFVFLNKATPSGKRMVAYRVQKC